MPDYGHPITPGLRLVRAEGGLDDTLELARRQEATRV